MRLEQTIKTWISKLTNKDKLESRVFELEKSLNTLKNSGYKDMEILEGTEYSKFFIPLDYKPSQDFSPRYGYKSDRIRLISDFFELYNDDYLTFLDEMHSLKINHIPVSSTQNAITPSWLGGPICAFDSLALYTMIFKYKPSIYLEVGSGMTTSFAKLAINDSKIKTKIISIDPQPRKEIDDICDLVVRSPLEICDLSIFDSLNPNDIIFIDGSHRSFMNSDVTVFFIDILPKIQPGVLIHIHDVTLPWDYPESFKYWYWNEQYLLAVYLMASFERIRPILPTAWICRNNFFGKNINFEFIGLGNDELNQSWRGGGSMWFTKLDDQL
ncbi:class I SAM-dependent methyltransferase [Endozoicomonas sp. 2B-B]